MSDVSLGSVGASVYLEQKSVDGVDQKKPKLDGHAIAVADNSEPLMARMSDSMLENFSFVVKLTMAVGVKTRDIKEYTAKLKSKKVNELEKKQASEEIASIILNKDLTQEQLFKLNNILCPKENPNVTSEEVERECEGNEGLDVDIARVEYADEYFESAKSQCKHIRYYQDKGYYTKHVVKSARYDQPTDRRGNTGQRSQGILSPEADSINLHTDSRCHLTCKQLDLMLEDKKQFELNHPHTPKYKNGDNLTRVQQRTNTKFAGKLYNIALCIDSKIRREIDPQEFKFLSVRIKVSDGYKPLRMLNIKSVINLKNEYIFESTIVDSSEYILVENKTKVSNLLEVVFSDLAALTDYTENNKLFKRLFDDGKIKVDQISSCSSQVSDSENPVSSVKSTLNDEQSRFAKCTSTHTDFSPPHRTFANMSTLDIRNFARTFRNRTASEEVEIYCMEKPVERQLYECKEMEFQSFTNHKLTDDWYLNP